MSNGQSNEPKNATHSQCAIDDTLSDEALNLVFQRLEWRDLFRLEGVCQRWRRVAKKWGWAKYKTFNTVIYEKPKVWSGTMVS